MHCLYNMPFSTKLLTLQGNCKHKQCFICHALSYSRLRAKLETKNMSGRERVKAYFQGKEPCSTQYVQARLSSSSFHITNDVALLFSLICLTIWELRKIKFVHKVFQYSSIHIIYCKIDLGWKDDRKYKFAFSNRVLEIWNIRRSSPWSGPVANWSTKMDRTGPFLRHCFWPPPQEIWNMGRSIVRSGPEKSGPVRGPVQLQIGPLKWTGPVHF